MRVEAFRVLTYPPSDPEHFERYLKELVGDGTFPRHACVVSWPSRLAEARFTLRPVRGSLVRAASDYASSTIPGLSGWVDDALVGVSIIARASDESVEVLFAAADRTDVRSLVSPFRRAGFVIESLTTPGHALAAVARTRGLLPSESAAAYLALHRDQAMLSVVARGALVSARRLRCVYPDEPEDGRARLLQRYTFVSGVGAELSHVFGALRDEHGIGIERIVLCGTLPSLRSLTEPLAEEFNLEVEVLDSLDTIDPRSVPQPHQEFCDAVAGLRTAWAVAVEGTPVNLWPREAGRVRVPRRVAMVGASALATSAAAAAVVSYVLVTAPGTPPAEHLEDATLVTSQGVAAEVASAPGVGSIIATAEAVPGEGDALSRPVSADQPAPVPTTDFGQGDAVASGGDAGDPTPAPPAEIAAAQSPAESTSRPQGSVAPVDPGPAQMNGPRLSPTPRGRDVRIALPAPTRAVDDGLDVVSILFAGDRKLAIVNGQIVNVGDRVGGFDVIEILPSSVVFRDAGNRIVRVLLRGGA